MTVGMISLIIAVTMLACVCVFELVQIKLLWQEVKAKRKTEKETAEIVDIHTRWLNNMSDEMRECTKVLAKLP